MAHAQKPDFVFRRNGRVHLNRRKGRVGGGSVQSTTGSRGVRISGSNAGYTMFRGSVKSTGYPLHSPVSPSLPLPCVIVCHHISTGLYNSKALFDELCPSQNLETISEYDLDFEMSVRSYGLLSGQNWYNSLVLSGRLTHTAHQSLLRSWQSLIQSKSPCFIQPQVRGAQTSGAGWPRLLNLVRTNNFEFQVSDLFHVTLRRF